MEFRKLISFGKSSYVVSLPKNWVSEHNMKKGDLIVFEKKNNDLILSPKEEKKGESVEVANIDAAKLGKMIKRTIASLYKGGYDVMNIKFTTPEQLTDIQTILKSTCIGFEIVNQERNMVVAKKISDAIYEEFDTMLKRSFIFLRSMAQDSLDAAKNQDKDALGNVVLSDMNINKFTDFCRRVLNKKSPLMYKKPAPLYYILEELEKIGDEFKYLCGFLINNKVTVTREFENVYQSINDFLGLTYDLFYKFDLYRVGVFGDAKGRIQEQLNKLENKVAKKNDVIVAFSLRKIFERIFDLNGAIIASSYRGETGISSME